jgi:predicted metal-binding protein
MKKKTLKLTLHRETLANLSKRHLEGAAGAGEDTLNKSCLLSCFVGCSDIGCTDTCPPTIIHTCYCE